MVEEEAPAPIARADSLGVLGFHQEGMEEIEPGL
jgi:hypothetical protein